MRLVMNTETYLVVMRALVQQARKYLWLVTADIKDVYTEDDLGTYVPFLAVLAGKLRDGVEVRIIHAKEPGPRFREEFDKYSEFLSSDLFERILCPRMHMKCVIADGKSAYIGSANLTGAGMGAKADDRRNFEAGILTEDEEQIQRLMEFLDAFYLGDYCATCLRREVCPEPIR